MSRDAFKIDSIEDDIEDQNNLSLADTLIDNDNSEVKKGLSINFKLNMKRRILNAITVMQM